MLPWLSVVVFPAGAITTVVCGAGVDAGDTDSIVCVEAVSGVCVAILFSVPIVCEAVADVGAGLLVEVVICEVVCDT